MNNSKTRCLSLALVLVGVLVIGSGVALGQGTGLGVSITCDAMAVDQGTLNYHCFFTVINGGGDLNNDLVVTVDPPGIPGPGTVQCFQGGFNAGDGGVAVTDLAASGNAGDRCSGDLIDGTVPFSCSTVGVQFNFEVSATASDAGGDAGGGTINGPFINGINCDDSLACTTDSCTPGPGDGATPGGCVHTAVVCDDSNLCTIDSCDPATGSTTVCATTAVTCDDSNLCTIDSCDPATGSTTACLTTAVVCDDGDECTIDSCDPATGSTTACLTTPNPDPACSEIEGRMTGGGSIFTSLAFRVTHGFELHCDELDLPNNLEINWGRGNNFHLEELLTARCEENAAIIQQPPGHSPFDTFIGTGIGRCNGVSGALIEFTFVDAGEPGGDDTADIEITGCPNGLALSVSGDLKKGNHQAHRNTP